jgi:cell wall-associated NlpC family hydrolase
MAGSGGASTSDPSLKAPKKATLSSAGKVTPPAGAPPEVVRAINAANSISGKPYHYGGGHGSWTKDSGYDCSGAVSYVLHKAKASWIDSPRDAVTLMDIGQTGKGRWITWYGSSSHAFMVIAGIRFDTGYHDGASGPRWSTSARPTSGFSARHPAGF